MDLHVSTCRVHVCARVMFSVKGGIKSLLPAGPRKQVRVAEWIPCCTCHRKKAVTFVPQAEAWGQILHVSGCAMSCQLDGEVFFEMFQSVCHWRCIGNCSYEENSYHRCFTDRTESCFQGLWMEPGPGYSVMLVDKYIYGSFLSSQTFFCQSWEIVIFLLWLWAEIQLKVSLPRVGESQLSVHRSLQIAQENKRPLFLSLRNRDTAFGADTEDLTRLNMLLYDIFRFFNLRACGVFSDILHL